jgi:hypothetical protein
MHTQTPMTQANLSKRSKKEIFDIAHWRERFREMKSKLPKNWMGKLAQYNSEFDTHEGTLTMMAVQKERAGLAKTVSVVTNLEVMLANPKPNQESTYQKWKSKKLVKP